MVHPLRVVPEEISEELRIEAFEVQEEKMLVPVQEFLLDGPVEALDMRIHLGAARVGMVVHDGEAREFGGEVLLPLAAVVREDEGNLERKHLLEQGEELFGGEGGMGKSAQGEAHAAEEVHGGHDIASHPVPELFHRIEGHAVAGILSLEILGFPKDLFPIHPLQLPEVGDLLRRSAQAPEVSYQAAHGADSGTLQVLALTKLLKQRVELVFAQIGVRLPEALHLLQDAP